MYVAFKAVQNMHKIHINVIPGAGCAPSMFITSNTTEGTKLDSIPTAMCVCVCMCVCECVCAHTRARAGAWTRMCVCVHL